MREYRRTMVGERFCDIIYSEIKPRNKRQADILEYINKNPGESYYLWGDVGTGKSHIMIGLWERDIRLGGRHDTVYIIDTELRSRLLGRIKDKTVFVPISTEALQEGIQHVFIDDLGKSKVSEYYQEQMFAIINEMYRSSIRLVMSSNYSLDELSQIYTAGTIRRIENICEVIKF